MKIIEQVVVYRLNILGLDSSSSVCWACKAR